MISAERLKNTFLRIFSLPDSSTEAIMRELEEEEIAHLKEQLSWASKSFREVSGKHGPDYERFANADEKETHIMQLNRKLRALENINSPTPA
jgi:hypothetical protein